MKLIRIIGAGGFGREVFHYVKALSSAGSPLRVVGFIDDTPVSTCCDLPVTSLESVEPLPEECCVIAVGDPRARATLAARARSREFRFFTLVHPEAHVAETAIIGEGSIVSPFAFVGPSARLGEHVVMNVFSGADHDSVIERFAYLAPHSFVGGGAKVEEGAVLGMHAGVGPGARVASGDRVAAGVHLTLGT